jgi:hypothetical protein
MEGQIGVPLRQAIRLNPNARVLEARVAEVLAALAE